MNESRLHRPSVRRRRPSPLIREPGFCIEPVREAFKIEPLLLLSLWFPFCSYFSWLLFQSAIQFNSISLRHRPTTPRHATPAIGSMGLLGHVPPPPPPPPRTGFLGRPRRLFSHLRLNRLLLFCNSGQPAQARAGRRAVSAAAVRCGGGYRIQSIREAPVVDSARHYVLVEDTRQHQQHQRRWLLILGFLCGRQV